jgi:S-adenosylmethionine decarboxylase
MHSQGLVQSRIQNPTYPAVGYHLLVTMSGCQSDLLSDEEALRMLVHEAATATGATVLQVASHRFSPHGCTAVAILAESHASLHTYPESGVVFWDCFTCGEVCNPEHSVEVLTQALNPVSVDTQVITRGTML